MTNENAFVVTFSVFMSVSIVTDGKKVKEDSEKKKEATGD